MPNINNNDIEGSILNCAKELFVQRGYEKVDMKLIAKKCNISIGTVYNYFPNKSKILIKLLNENWNETFKKIQSLNSLNANARISKLVDILYDHIDKTKDIDTNVINYELLKKHNDEVITSIAHIINSFEHNPNDVVNYLYSTTFVKAILDYITELIKNDNTRADNLILLYKFTEKLIYNKL